ncbi:MAG TPA: polyprenyl synthetase family protein [Anaerolineales bacterium]|nr:polyprenyl synthetase family protein [Anaerolineales bacterium]
MIEATFTALVEDRLGLVEERMRAQADGHHPAVGAALHHLLSSGGKRIRVIVTLLTGKMLGADEDKLITLAAAIESLHTATLVHDDLIDGAMIRRGIPTLNAQWSPAATVLTGDFIFSKAAKLASDTGSIEVMKIFAETLATIVNGEIIQLFSSRWVANREDYYRRIYAKTASLFETSTTAAAILSNADPQVTATVKYFGYEIGMAFQIIDDILDFTSEQTTMGKPVASDLRQGIITLPVLYYLESHPKDEEMKNILESNFCDEDCLGRLLASIRDSGAIKLSHEEARQAVQRGLDSLMELPENEERKALEDLAGYIVDREI